MRFFTLLMLTIFLNYAGFSQQAVSKMVETYKDAGVNFSPVNLFQNSRTSIDERNDIKEVVSKATILKINQQALRTAIDANKSAISLPIPSLYRQDLVLELVQVDIFAPGFQVTTSDGRGLEGADLGLHYRGIINGIENSLVAISIFENEIAGFIADDEGNLVLGKMEGKNPENEHILYLDNNMNVQPDYECGVQDDESPYAHMDLEEEPTTRAPGDCLRIYVEVNTDLYNNKGSETTNYVTGVFNQSAALYANEGITIGMSDLYIWTSSSPYTGSGSGTLLQQFQNYRNSFDGDLAHLLSLASVGGIAAGFSGVCNPNLDANMCFSGINTSYSNVPTWSWSVSVFTHEMGHLIGCRHTHACVWNGNNTAIDGCGTIEGSCFDPGDPSGGGSIMSYCHLTGTGISFTVGFGPQPRQVMLDRIANATCLGTSCVDTCNNGELDPGEEEIDCGGPECPACPTCSDGEWNGDEEGPDCGGSDPACPVCPPCSNLTLSLVLDNYPEETSWRILYSGTIVASGGTYGNQADGASVTENICLTPGLCYNFIMQDLYQDGMCCGYGNGSYSLVVDATGVVLASGGEFGNSETTEICIENNGPCSDGVMNGDETGIDCGGSVCPPCPTCNDGLQNQGETGVDCGGPCEACPTCDDGIQNQGEVAIDCGGPCPACPTCNDGIQNQGEEGIDCGGPCPTVCPPNDCLIVDLNSYTVSAYGNGQDNGSSNVTNGYIVVYNNAWKSIAMDYTITANTVIAFDFGSTIQGEIHAIGFDNNSSYSSNYTFQLHGTQNWGITDYKNYANLGYWTSFTIPVGQHYTGAMNRLFFLADHDSGSKNGNSYFKNIKIYEGSCGTAMPQFGSYVVEKMFPDDDESIKARTNASTTLAKAILFPNPTEEVLNVSLAPEFTNGQMTVVDLYGKVIMTKSVTDVNMKLSVVDLTAGMYFLQVQNGDHKQIEKFVVRH